MTLTAQIALIKQAMADMAARLQQLEALQASVQKHQKEQGTWRTGTN